MRKILATALTGAFTIAIMIALYAARPATLSRIDNRIYDLLLPLRSAPAPSPVPVIIDIDEASLAEYGQWPWPRYLVADLVAALDEYGVASIGIDIMFAEPDNSSPSTVASSLRRDRGINLDFTGLPGHLRDYDGLLASQLSRSPVVLGAYASSGPEAEPPGPGLSIKIHERAKKNSIPYDSRLSSARGAIMPLAPFVKNAAIGFINVDPDPDGIVRKIPLLIRVGGDVYPSLALRTLMRGAGADDIMATGGPDGLESVRMGRYFAAASPSGEMFIPFIGPGRTYPYFSAADVLKGKIPGEQLRGRVAFVGTSSAGLLDIRSTPFDKIYPGVEVHAAAVDAILAGNSITVPSWTAEMQLVYIFVAGVISAVLFGFASPALYIPTAGAVAGASVLLARYFFRTGYFVSPLYAIMTVAAAGTLIVTLRFGQEQTQRRMLRRTFSRYVSPRVVNRIMREKGDLFAGEERELSILFSDIRGFTSISERLTPKQTVNLLNRYFTPMTALIQERDGTLDKFMGDAIMAFWNAPLDVHGHAALALDAALSMREKLDALNGELSSEFGVALNIGIGIHTGAAYVGNMGSKDLVNYTLIGDNVNLASRLEGLCKQYGAGVITSGETSAASGDNFSFQYLDTIRVKGKTAPVKIYAPMRSAEGLSRAGELSEWSEAVKSYLGGDFGRARDAFQNLSQNYPGSTLYHIFERRAATLADSPPREWDGIWTMESK